MAARDSGVGRTRGLSHRKGGGSVGLHLSEGMSEAFTGPIQAAPESISAISKIVEFVRRELRMSHPRDAIPHAEAQPDADGKRKGPLKL